MTKLDSLFASNINSYGIIRPKTPWYQAIKLFKCTVEGKVGEGQRPGLCFYCVRPTLPKLDFYCIYNVILLLLLKLEVIFPFGKTLVGSIKNLSSHL